MITASTRYTLIQDSKVLYTALDIHIIPAIHNDIEMVRIEVNSIGDSLSIAPNAVQGNVTLEFTYAEISAFTASGTDEVDQFFNQCEQVVVDYLEAIPENSSVTFTIV